MRTESLELGLGLSLGGLQTQTTQPSFRYSAVHLPSPEIQNQHRRNPWTELFHSSDRENDARSFFGGIDVNRAPSAAECEEEGGLSSPNSTISSLSGKRSERDAIGDENDVERASSSRGSDEEDGGEASRKKLRLSKEQSIVLEETFKEHNTLNTKQKQALAEQLNLRPRQVEVWFQNRRARTKLKQTEVDCEHLKRSCDKLTEENRRLHKEVQELRALKLNPQLYTHMNPPTTLTMCPSCERVAVSSSSAAAASRKPRPMSASSWASMPVGRRHPDAPPSRS